MRSDGRDDDGTPVDDAECIAETEKAILVRIKGRKDNCWVPKSQVTDDSEVFKYGDVGQLVVRTWFANQERLTLPDPECCGPGLEVEPRELPAPRMPARAAKQPEQREFAFGRSWPTKKEGKDG